MLRSRLTMFLASLLLASPALAADAPSFSSRPDSWFATDEAHRTLDNILSWQGHGPGNIMGWPKAYDATQPRPADGGGIEWEGTATIDNGATYTELRLLARAITLEKDDARKKILRDAFDKGLDAAFAAQYDNGGWPQRWPKPNNYGSHITFNDNAMTRLLQLLKEAGAGSAPFAFVDDERKKKAQAAYDKGIDCILKCQIIAGGKLTGWCAQHDENTLKPANARAYELASISGSEGGEILSLLMKIEKPDDRVKKAIDAGAAWFAAAKITGKRIQNTTTNGQRDRVLVDDPAGILWARFYDVDTGKPIFCGRDGIKKKSLAEIEQERRAGYAWYGNWGANVEREYTAWKKRVNE
ncbi:MAG TPA: pectate lyase [Phycisphaerae bacterium]|nr:pectate lyase [Phycisphaerae bacterium]